MSVRPARGESVQRPVRVRQKPGRLGALLTATLAAAVLVLVAGGSGAAARVERLQTSAARGPPQAPIAKRLAKRVTSARTPSARYKALLNVMRTLNLAVYTSKGKPVLRGGNSALHVYDFELMGLARVLPRDRTWTLAELARELGALGVRPGGEPLSGERLSAVLSAGVRAALRKPRDRYALVPLLVRELGLLRRPAQDLARPAAPDVARLDGLQRFLILADLSEAVSARAKKRAGGSAALAAAHETVHASSRLGRQLAEGGACRVAVEAGADKLVKIGKWLVPLVRWLPNPVRASAAWLDNTHALVLGLLIDVQPARGGQVSDTHYGPAENHPGFTEPHHPGQQLVFQVGVQSLIPTETEGQKTLIACFELAGLKLPPEGPLAGVPVNWDHVGLGDYAKLLAHGRVVREDRVTGKDGLAILVFEPKDEAVPGFGKLKTEVGVLQPTFTIFSPFGNLLGNLPELLTPPFATMPWSVEYHEPRGTLSFDSQLTVPCWPGRSCPVEFVLHVRGQVAIAPDASGMPTGQGALVWVEGKGSAWLGGDAHCVDGSTGWEGYRDTLVGTAPGVLAVARMTTPSPGAIAVAVTDMPSPPTETYSAETWICGRLSAEQKYTLRNWHRYWEAAHVDEVKDPKPQYLFELVLPSDGGGFFRKEYRRTVMLEEDYEGDPFAFDAIPVVEHTIVTLEPSP